ncbi:hypothetical protein [Pseudomonas sp.]|uniref:hypothetical protein n=1 Tax=Pseudomonas sp. TaxID=306 RepID=UPI0037CB7519
MMTRGVREFRLLSEFRKRLALDLDGLVVATEAGTGPFLYSALAAALAGAKKVIAVAPDSIYAKHLEIKNDLVELACLWGISDECISVVDSREMLPEGIDIFLNLGFIRPLDEILLSKASRGAVVSYMSESWEFRPGDLDLDYCRDNGIPVAGVNEEFDGFGVFTSCGQLALKLLFESGLEVAGCRVCVLSDDPFGDVIEKALLANSAEVFRVKSSAMISLDAATSLDALVVASYSAVDDALAGLSFSFESLSSLNPHLKIIQFCGRINVSEITKTCLEVYPREQLHPYRMSRTLSYLGVRPVLALHSLGIKAGEILYRQKNGLMPSKGWDSLLQRII